MNPQAGFKLAVWNHILLTNYPFLFKAEIQDAPQLAFPMISVATRGDVKDNQAK